MKLFTDTNERNSFFYFLTYVFALWAFYFWLGYGIFVSEVLALISGAATLFLVVTPAKIIFKLYK